MMTRLRPAQSRIEAVTDDVTTVQAAEAEIADFFLAATYNLTTGVDAGDQFSGDIADDVFNAPIGLGIDGLVGVQTLQGSDVLDGGAGMDVLNVEVNGTGANGNPAISDIEVYNITSFDALLGGSGSLDLSRATGYEQLWNRGSDVDLELDNVSEQAVIGLDAVRGGTSYTVGYEADLEVSDQVVVAQSVGTPATGAATVNINGTAVGSLALLASGSRINVAADQDVSGTVSFNVIDDNIIDVDANVSAAPNLSIAGEGALDLMSDSDFAGLQNLESVDYAEGLVLNASGSAVLETVTTGAGDDVITIDTVVADGDLVVDLGEGFDILEINGADDQTDISAIDFSAGVVGVENLAFGDRAILSGDAVLDLDGVSDELETVWFFDGLVGGTEQLALINVPVEDLRIDATIVDYLALDTGNVVNLEINTSDGRLDIDPLTGDALETLVLNQNGDDVYELFLNIDGGVDNLNALTSIEANANGDEGDEDGTTAEVYIYDDGGSLTDGLQSLSNVAVTSDDLVFLELIGAASGIIAAEAAVDDAESDLLAAQGELTTAETNLFSAETARDNRLVDQGLALSDLNDAQGVFDVAQDEVDDEIGDVAAAQGVLDDAEDDVSDAQDALDAAQGALDAAQAKVDGFNAYLAAFDYDVDTSFFGQAVASAANREALESYILANNDLSTAQTNALIALIPGGGLPPSFNSQGEFDDFLDEADSFLTTDYDIVGLTAARDAADDTLDLAQDARDAAQDSLDIQEGQLDDAESARDVAQDDLDDAQDAFDSAVDAVSAASDALADAEDDLADAEADVATAQAALATAQANLAAATPEGTGFEALQTVSVEAGTIAQTFIEDAYGAFDLQVNAGVSTDIFLIDTGVVNASVSAGSTFDYIIDAVTGDVTGVNLGATLGLADVSAVGGTYGNQDLVTMTVSGAAALVVLEDGLSSFTTLDLTDVANAFNVDAADAIFAPDDGGYVSYLVGSTASEFGGFLDGGDSLIAMADARESVTFTEEQFGTIVLENFISGADPQVGDRIDVSDLGYTNNGQLLFETGTYDKASGDFTVDAGNDLRISDVDGGPAMDGEIILIGIDNPDDLATYNIIYA
jgi:hypothetical protein